MTFDLIEVDDLIVSIRESFNEAMTAQGNREGGRGKRVRGEKPSFSLSLFARANQLALKLAD
jgi:hypothetical protein